MGRYFRSLHLVLVLLVIISAFSPTHAVQSVAQSITIEAVLLDDSSFTETIGTDAITIQDFLENQPGILKNHKISLDEHDAPAAQIIVAAGLRGTYSINPQILLTLLELRTNLVSMPSPSGRVFTDPLNVGTNDNSGFFAQLVWISMVMEDAFTAYRVGASRLVALRDGTTIDLVSSPNAATFAIQSALAALAENKTVFDALIGDQHHSFVVIYQQFFGNQNKPRSINPAATAPFLHKPFSSSFTVGSFFDHDARDAFFRRFDGATSGSYDNHTGVDFPMSEGNEVIAAAGGTVIDIAINRTEGNPSSWCNASYTPVTGMRVEHVVGSITYRTEYWHLSAGAIAINPNTGQQFRVGDTILRGQRVGLSGSTGCSTGPHLHFGVQRSGVVVDPYGWCGQGGDPWTSAPNEMLWAETMTNPSPCPYMNIPPNPPILVAPSNEIAANNSAITLSWQDPGDSDNYPRDYRDYIVEIWKSDNSWSQSWGWNTATSWSMTIPGEGRYYWRVLSGDGAVGSNWSPIWYFTVDTVPPTGGYTEPANDTAFQNSVMLRGSATDNLSGVDHINFTAHYDGDWHIVHTDYEAPYEYDWNISGMSDRSLLIGYDIYDKAGNYALSPQGVRTIIKDATAPNGGYTEPENDTIVFNDIALRGIADDNLSGVDHINFTAHYDGDWHIVYADYQAPYEYDWDISSLSDQTLLLGYDIYDRAGNYALAPQGVRVVYKAANKRIFVPLLKR